MGALTIHTTIKSCPTMIFALEVFRHRLAPSVVADALERRREM
jgi:hypothetical protein